MAWLLVATLGVAALALFLRPGAETTTDRDRTIRFMVAPPNGGNFTSSISHPPFAMSPDGRHLAFTAIGADKRRGLYLHSFDSLVSRLIPGTEGAWGPFWSPDSLDPWVLYAGPAETSTHLRW